MIKVTFCTRLYVKPKTGDSCLEKRKQLFKGAFE